MLTRNGEYDYGDTQADIRQGIAEYSSSNRYPAERFVDVVCGCGGRIFQLWIDDAQGAALRRCSGCGAEHPMADSATVLDAELEQSFCLCDGDTFEVTAAVALYEKSDDVRWLYLGCRCPACGLIGVYGDWKNEFEDYRRLLALV